jgi:ketosteroid isomerase-like protein
MSDLSPRSIVLNFIDLLNVGDIDGLNSLISEDLKFTDIQGDVYWEKGFMAGYPAEFPDYKIHIHHALSGGDGVAIIGKVSGSHFPQEKEVQEILVWTAEVRDGVITEWRIYSHVGHRQKS